MIALKKRLNILAAKLRKDEYLKHSGWNDVVHEMFKRYGRDKEKIREGMMVESMRGMLKITIGAHSVYWPAGAGVERLVDMYFEVFNSRNNHCFDLPEAPIEKGDVVIDCGTCEGYFTHKALQAGASAVYCVEPGENIAGCLERSFAAEIEQRKVVICRNLLGAENKRVDFLEDPEDPTICRSLTGTQTGGPVVHRDMMTLDALCREQSVPRVDFIKADVEGEEVRLMYGAEETIRRFKPKIAIAVYHSPENANLVVQFVTKLQLNYAFRVKGIVDFDGVPRPVMVHCYRKKGTAEK